MSWNRIYDACFYFNVAAVIAVVLLSRMWELPTLITAAIPFTLAAACFRLAVWARKRSGVEP